MHFFLTNHYLCMDIKLEGISEFKQIMEARIKECGKNARIICTALFLNIFKEIRTKTQIAKYTDNELKVILAPQYSVGYRREKGAKGKHQSERVLLEGAHRVDLKSLNRPVFWLTSNYVRHEQYYVFYVKDLARSPIYEYLIVAKNLNEAFKYAKDKKIKNINRYKGLAQTAIGIIRQKLMNEGIQNGNTSGNLNTYDTANKLTRVNITDTQLNLNSRNVSILAHDQLDYAELAIAGGKTQINSIINSQLRKTAGLVAHFTKNNDIRQSMLLAIDKLKD